MNPPDLTTLVRDAELADAACNERRHAVYQAIVDGDPECALLLQRMGSPVQCEAWLFQTALRFGGKRPVDIDQLDRSDLLEFMQRKLPHRPF
jgi:hypothetical protein